METISLKHFLERFSLHLTIQHRHIEGDVYYMANIPDLYIENPYINPMIYSSFLDDALDSFCSMISDTRLIIGTSGLIKAGPFNIVLEKNYVSKVSLEKGRLVCDGNN